MSHWSKFYKGRVGETYPEYCATKYKPFIDEILKGNPSEICEEGCGIGTIAKVVKKIDSEVRINISDIDKDQIKLAEQNLKNYTDVQIEPGNILSKKYDKVFDVIVGHGVLEHFTDNQICWIINRQKVCGKKIIHYVPTIHYLTPDRKTGIGDERLMTIERWKKLVYPTKIETWNNGKDAILIWE